MAQAQHTRLHATVDGHVQGVGFRAFVYEIGQSMSLTGWVRNTFEGKVEVVAEGQRDDLEILLRYLKQGPRAAFVTEVAQEWSQATGEFTSFDVRRTV